jgi:hypothetical protein
MDADRLLRISVFAALSDAELSRLAAFATEESFPVGARLIREGDFSTELYAIEEGTADIVRGGETIDDQARGHRRRDRGAGQDDAERRCRGQFADARDQGFPLGDPSTLGGHTPAIDGAG